MKTSRRLLCTATLLMGMASGCQTWVPQTGQTLPSPDYLHHQPQYFPQSPPYPLPRERAALEEAQAAQQNAPPGFVNGN